MAVTLGMRDLLDAARIRLYTDGGAWKQTILRILLFSEPTVDYPVTLVHEHPDVHVVADCRLRGLSAERLVRITELRTTIVSVPFREDETWIWGRRRGMTNALVQVETDEGLTGIGECPGHPSIAFVREVLSSIRDVLVGEDPLRIERILPAPARAPRPPPLPPRGERRPRRRRDRRSGTSLARQAGQPLANLLGGPVRDRVPYYRYIPMGPSDWMARAGGGRGRGGISRRST
jgi:hypothetical protein